MARSAIPLCLWCAVTFVILLTFAAAHRHGNCSLFQGQKIDPMTIRIAWQTGMLSSMVYLSYEQDQHATNLPRALSLEATAGSRRAFLRAFLTTKMCQIQNLLRRSYYLLWNSYPLRMVRSLSAMIPFRKSTKSSIRHATKSSAAALPMCAVHETEQEEFVFRWFMGDFKEGIWHDTEVLLAESQNVAAVIFRGSDSPADLFTNSQTMEPATHSYYFGCVDGSIHRGMLNAYARVDRGKMVPLDVTTGLPSAFGSSILDTFHDIRSIQSSSSGSSSSSDSSYQRNDHNVTVDDAVEVNNLLLPNLLIPAVLSALRSGKKVVLGGHSLGGSLALLLAMDVLTNYCAPGAADTVQLTAPADQLERDHDLHSRCKHSQHRAERDLGRHCPPEAIDHHLFDRLHVVTFGQPDIADAAFFEDLRDIHPAVDALLEHRYSRFISLSKSCEPDIVTELVDRVGSVIGRRLAGIRKRVQKKLSGANNQSMDASTGRKKQGGKLKERLHRRGAAAAGATGSSKTGTKAGAVTGAEAEAETGAGAGATKRCDLGQCYFIGSGRAENAIDAHSMAHYLHGLHHLGVSYDHNTRRTSTSISTSRSSKSDNNSDSVRGKGKGTDTGMGKSVQHDRRHSSHRPFPDNKAVAVRPPSYPPSSTVGGRSGIRLSLSLSTDTARKLDLFMDDAYAATVASNNMTFYTLVGY